MICLPFFLEKINIPIITFQQILLPFDIQWLNNGNFLRTHKNESPEHHKIGIRITHVLWLYFLLFFNLVKILLLRNMMEYNLCFHFPLDPFSLF